MMMKNGWCSPEIVGFLLLGHYRAVLAQQQQDHPTSDQVTSTQSLPWLCFSGGKPLLTERQKLSLITLRGRGGRCDGTVYFSLLWGRKSTHDEMDFDGFSFAWLAEASRCIRFWLLVWKNKTKQTKPKQTTKPPQVPVLPQSPEVRKQQVRGRWVALG